jgi:hypothetical protein
MVVVKEFEESFSVRLPADSGASGTAVMVIDLTPLPDFLRSIAYDILSAAVRAIVPSAKVERVGNSIRISCANDPSLVATTQVPSEVIARLKEYVPSPKKEEPRVAATVQPAPKKIEEVPPEQQTVVAPELSTSTAVPSSEARAAGSSGEMVRQKYKMV